MFGAVSANLTRAPAFVSMPCSEIVCVPASSQSTHLPPSSSLRSLMSHAILLNCLSVCLTLLRMWLSLLFPSTLLIHTAPMQFYFLYWWFVDGGLGGNLPSPPYLLLCTGLVGGGRVNLKLPLLRTMLIRCHGFHVH